METPPILAAYGISFKRESSLVLNELSFELGRGDFISLIGANGSGKTTLLKVLAGLLKQSSGQLRYRGSEMSGFDVTRRARAVGYLGAELWPEFPLLCSQIVAFGRLCHRPLERALVEKSIQEAMELCGCWQWKDRMIQELSGGERQLVALARLVAQDSSVMILDESLSKMDLHHQSAVGRMLRDLSVNKGKVIVLVSHDINFAAEWAENSIMLNAGKILAQGKTKEVLSLANLKTIYPGAELLVKNNPSTGAPQVFFAPT
jgi:iron complex transport system ATP-binding protein